MLNWKEISLLPYKTTGTESRFNCVFCETPDTGYHLYVNRKRKVYHCFRCGARGVLLDSTRYGSVLREYDERIEEYKNGVGEGTSAQKVVKSLPLNTGLDARRKEIDTAPFLAYLKSRRIPRGRADKCNVRVCKEQTGIYSNTLIFPIGSLDSPKYFVCRKIDDSLPKYINAPWPKGNVLYTPMVHVASPYTVICEGVFDALRISLVARAQALLGKEANADQIERILADPCKYYLVCLDPDAQTYALKLATMLKMGGKRVQVVDLKVGDPGSTDKERLKGEFQDAYFRECSRGC